MSEGGGPDTHPRAPVLVLSGPSAVGKSTVVKCVRDRVADLHFSVSVTTRAPRPGEIDGIDYSFVSPERFQQLIDDGELLEWAYSVVGSSQAGHLVDLAAVRRMLDEHRSGTTDHSRRLWTVLIFMLRYAIFVEKSVTPQISEPTYPVQI